MHERAGPCVRGTVALAAGSGEQSLCMWEAFIPSLLPAWPWLLASLAKVVAWGLQTPEQLARIQARRGKLVDASEGCF